MSDTWVRQLFRNFNESKTYKRYSVPNFKQIIKLKNLARFLLEENAFFKIN